MTDSKGGFRTVLRNRQYLLWVSSSNTASVGYSVYAISIVWLTFSVTHSYAVVGAVLFVEYAAYTGTFLLAPLVDRVQNQRTIYLASYPVQAAAAAAIGVTAADGTLTVPLLIALVLVISLLWDLAWAAYQAAPRILLDREALFAAGGVAGAVGGASSIAGYAVGGALILVVGAAGGMFLYAALLGVGAVLALPLRVHPGTSPPSGFGASFREGWRTLAEGVGRPLLQLASVDTIQGFFTAGAALLIALLSVSSFGDSGAAYALLFTTYIVGGVVAGLALGWFNPRGRAGVIMIGSLLGSGLGLAAFGVAPALLVVAALVWLLVGFFLSAYSDAKYTFLRGSVSPHQLGRVSANMYLFPGIASAVGALALGLLAGRLSAVAFGFLLGAGLLAAGALAAILPGVRALRY